jgi:CheY-like chemotaxis protein
MIDGGADGGEFICPTCLARIPLVEPAPVASAAGSAAPTRAVEQGKAAAETLDPSTSAPTATTRPSAEARETGAPSPPVATVAEEGEIVCPRCKLHFYPRGRRSAPRDPERHTVLIVEDQEYFRQIAADALDSAYDVKTASGIDEAKAILAAGGIDLLVLDLNLGGGEQGERLLRELRPKPCPILIFTAQDESELYGDRWEGLVRCGADDLVIKGMHVDESLRRKAGQLLGQPIEDDDR